MIEIRHVEELKDPSSFFFEKNEGGLFGLKVFIQKLWHDGLVGKIAITSIWGCRFKFQRGKY